MGALESSPLLTPHEDDPDVGHSRGVVARGLRRARSRTVPRNRCEVWCFSGWTVRRLRGLEFGFLWGDGSAEPFGVRGRAGVSPGPFRFEWAGGSAEPFRFERVDGSAEPSTWPGFGPAEPRSRRDTRCGFTGP